VFFFFFVKKKLAGIFFLNFFYFFMTEIESLFGALHGFSNDVFVYVGEEGDGEYVLRLTEQRRLDKRSLATLLRICELATMHRRVCARLEQMERGLVSQALIGAVRCRLTEYYESLADQKENHNLFSVANESLRRVLVWSRAPLRVMTSLCALLENVCNLRGGQLERAISKHGEHGAPWLQVLVNVDLLRVAHAPLIRMLARWVFCGELDGTDPFGEFFVAADRRVPMAQLWQRRFSARAELLPSFVDASLGAKILATGKSVFFLRECCAQGGGDLQCGDAMRAMAARLVADGVDALPALVDEAATLVNEQLLGQLWGRHRFEAHARTLRDFVLLGRGDFAHTLLERIGDELDKPASQLYRHHLVGIVDSAIRSSVGGGAAAADCDDELLHRVDVRLEAANGGGDEAEALGWDRFALVYTTSSPINAVLSAPAMELYSALFKLLWRVAHIRRVLARTWKRANGSLQRKLSLNMLGVAGADRDLQARAHRTHLLQFSMMHFAAKIEDYLNRQVIQVSFEQFAARARAARDLDELIGAHQFYLRNMCRRCLLDARCSTLKSTLLALFSVVLRYCGAVAQLHQLIVDRAHRSVLLAAEHSEDLILDLSLSSSNASELVPPPPSLDEQQRIDAVNTLLASLSTSYCELLDEFKRNLSSPSSSADDEITRELYALFESQVMPTPPR
jgi:gamma-tubulin complex component 3